jgi:hypothetical protein
MANLQILCAEAYRRCMNWTLQILLYIAIIVAPIFVVNDPNKNLWVIGFPILIYIIYIVNSLCSPSFAYLRNKNKANGIHDYMKTLYAAPPSKTFHIECYHFDTQIIEERDTNGNTRARADRVKVVTYKGSQEFRYYSWRDISGTFLLETGKLVKSKEKVYLKLKLGMEIVYADDGTQTDYHIQRDSFYASHRWRDQYMNNWETSTVPNFQEHTLVRVSDNEAPFVNIGLFVLFTLLPFIEFYKIYVNMYCEDQIYNLRKLVSSRNNLNQSTHFEKYEQMQPKLCIYGQEIMYGHETVLIQSGPYKPSQDEIWAHQQESKKTGTTLNVNIGNPTDSDNTASVNSFDAIIDANRNPFEKAQGFNPMDAGSTKTASTNFI